MKGFIPRTALGIGLGLLSLAGCAYYRDIFDPCWPERYNAMARVSVNEANNAQAYNGHVLDQTLWNYDFEHDPKTGAPTDRLNPAGMERLKYISRRRPVPDARIYLATAQDLGNLGDAPDKVSEVRTMLNNRRIVAIQNFLAAQAPGHSYAVEVHDPAEVGIAALQMTGSLPPAGPRPVVGGYQKLQDNFQGVFAGPASITQSLGGGSSGGGGTPGR